MIFISVLEIHYCNTDAENSKKDSNGKSFRDPLQTWATWWIVKPTHLWTHLLEVVSDCKENFELAGKKRLKFSCQHSNQKTFNPELWCHADAL